jgi:hypothetical protein
LPQRPHLRASPRQIVWLSHPLCPEASTEDLWNIARDRCTVAPTSNFCAFASSITLNRR